MKSKRILLIVMVLMLLFVFVGCKDSEMDDVKMGNLTIEDVYFCEPDATSKYPYYAGRIKNPSDGGASSAVINFHIYRSEKKEIIIGSAMVELNDGKPISPGDRFVFRAPAVGLKNIEQLEHFEVQIVYTEVNSHMEEKNENGIPFVPFI